jgi:predicted nucleic acid-binding protein
VLVVDAPVIASFVADGGPDGDKFRARLRGESIAGPDLLRVEVMSVIRRQADAGTLTVTQANRAIEDLLDLPVAIYPTGPFLRRVWALRNNVTSYDACYVALAEALGCTLLTGDTRLANAPGTQCAIEII